MTATGSAQSGAFPDRAGAFRELADHHLDAAYRLAHAILRDPIEAQDATHDAFVAAWRSWGSLRDRSKFEPWFDRIVINTCRNRLRRERRRPAVDISGEVALVAGDEFTHSLEREVIGQALAGLSPDHQVVVALRFYRDLPIPQIADRIGVPVGTVQSRLHYALKRLQIEIQATESRGPAR
jgi:RNA polymerase sigma-70 factor, ECF subfamily